jgi:hypothetical protein
MKCENAIKIISDSFVLDSICFEFEDGWYVMLLSSWVLLCLFEKLPFGYKRTSIVNLIEEQRGNDFYTLDLVNLQNNIWIRIYLISLPLYEVIYTQPNLGCFGHVHG